MRKIRYFLSFVLCVVALVGFSTMNAANAYSEERMQYFGEHCWESANGGFFRVGITMMGNGHFSFCGTVEWSSLKWAINGNLEVVGDSVVMTWVDALRQSGGKYVFGRVGDAILDLSTLDGTSNAMDMIWDNGVGSLGHSTDELFYMSCDKSPSPDGVDNKEELIRLFRKFATTPE